LELIAAEGRAAARRAETAGAKYSSRPVDAQGRDSLGGEAAPLPSLVGVVGQTFRDLGDSELYVVRRDEELLQVLASALPGDQSGAGAPPPAATGGDTTAEIPIGAEDRGDDYVSSARESPWHRAAIMVGLALLTIVGLIAFLAAP
jgi:hypothetical protein